ncbi:hypothetical protein SUGI_0885110 [Cryptomeria japonica]|uniref:DNA mismatch repair protein MSH3 n=1 Tax=Cryptomeria japonica TaxID=3369 RepID=UPI0024147ACA|nr:DNA mismatch repair protein MSH3 [Cryptomeria japonica]GLJ42692.1 hypothetical protein SUGI_0885110 [Cryptomeria japonica]
MKKQQVISRFFAPKSGIPSTKTPLKVPPPSSSSPCIAAAISWTPTNPKKRTHEEFNGENSNKGEEDPHQPFKRKETCNGGGIQTTNSNFEDHEETSEELSKIDKYEISLENRGSEPNNTIGFPAVGNSSFEPKKTIGIPAFDASLHKKFVEKLLIRVEENGSLEESTYGRPPTGKEKYTPLEEQVIELKAKYKDVLLMIEVGYKYRFFGDDAEVAARVLGIFAHYDHSFLTASIPTFRLHFHVRRLVEAGYKVGVVRQTETAALKAHGANKGGPFTRSLSALYTRATFEAAEALVEGVVEDNCRLNSYLMCVVEQPLMSRSPKKTKNRVSHEEDSATIGGCYDTMIGAVAVETSTGDVMYGQFKDTGTRAELESRLLNVSPAELLLGAPLLLPTEKLLLEFAGPASNVRVEWSSRDLFKDGGALAEVMSLYENRSDEISAQNNDGRNEGIEVIMAMPDLVVQALALSLRYLKQFKLERILGLSASFRPFASKNEMSFSSNTLQQLEVLRNNADGSENGSLLSLVNHTHTAFGLRLLKHWVTHPLCDRNTIEARLDAVSEIAESMGSSGGLQLEGTILGGGKGGGSQGLLASVLTSLGKMPDVERGITRIFHRSATAAEFITVINSLLTAAKQLQQLVCVDEDEVIAEDPSQRHHKHIGSQLLRRLISAASCSVVIENSTRFLSSLNKCAAMQGDKHNLFICAGNKFPEVAKCRAAVRAAEKLLDSFLPAFQKQLKLPNLEYLSVSGITHLIELPSATRVPSNWIKVSSTKKSNRYHPPEVLEALDKLAVAKEELTVACSKAWDDFLAEFAVQFMNFRAAVQALAALDCLHSLAIVSRNEGYVRPVFVEDSEVPQLSIHAGRHPVLESTLQESFVPNDTFLHGSSERCQIITGPNMGGKSCYIRQVALIVIMAQLGSFVPAMSAKLHVFDSVFTRMGASDSIQHGTSTFFDELSEASSILQKSTPCSLVIIDELGRGTSTHDGVALAYATLHFILKERKCLTLFVTHYPKIAELKNEFPGEVNPYHVSYLTSDCLADQILGDEPEDVSTFQNGALVEYDVGFNLVTKISQNITFLYKLVPGVASRSFGLHVARLAQLPDSCITQAAFMAAKFEKEVCARVLARSEARPSICNATVVDQSEIGRMLIESDSNKASLQLGGLLTSTDEEMVTSEIHQMLDTDRVSKSLCLVQSTLKESNLLDGLNALQRAQEYTRKILT